MMKRIQMVAMAFMFGLAGIAFSATTPETFTRTLTLMNGSTKVGTATMRLKKFSVRGEHFEVLNRVGANQDVPVTAGEVNTYMGTVDEYPGAVACVLRKRDGTFNSSIQFKDGLIWRELYNTGNTSSSAGAFVIYNYYDFHEQGIEYHMPNPATDPKQTVDPGEVGANIYAYDVGMQISHQYYSTVGKNSLEKTLEMAEFSALCINATYIRDAKLRPYLGRIIIITDEAVDPYYVSMEQPERKVRHYLDSVTAAWENEETDTHWDMIVAVAHSMNGALADPLGSACYSDGQGDFSATWRHEMGHSWWLGHYDGGSWPYETSVTNPGGTINVGAEGPTIMSGNQMSRFTGVDLARIMNRRDAQNYIAFTDNEGSLTDVDIPPYAAMDIRTSRPYREIRLNPLDNDHDANNHTLTLDSVQSFSNRGGTVSMSGNSIKYIAPNSYGEDYFTYTVRDSSGQTATGVVMVDVIYGGGGIYPGSGSAPVFSSSTINKPDLTVGDDYSGESLAGEATDVDNDTLIYSKVSGPSWLQVAQDGTLSGTPTVNDIGLNSWTVKVDDGFDGSDTAILQITVNGGQIAHWKFDETSGTVAVDSSSNGYSGTVTGPQWDNGILGGALTFAGGGDVVTTNASMSDLGAFTMSGWYKSDLVTGSKIALWGQDNCIEFGMDNGSVKAWTAGGGSVSSAIPTAGQWHHVVLVGNGTNLFLYIDGALASTGGKATSSYGSSSTTVNIGKRVWAWGDKSFEGSIDEVQIYTRELSAQEVGNLYQYNTIEVVNVPNVTGLTQVTAELNLVNAQLSVGAITTAYSNTIPAGYIISQSVSGGTTVGKDTGVDLVVSLGPETVTVPDVVGLSESSASDTLANADLTPGSITDAYSEVISAGYVTDQSVLAGSQVDRNTVVGLSVSIGVQPDSHWKMNEATGVVAADNVDVIDGTVNNAVWTVGKKGSGLYFDGVSASVTTGVPLLNDLSAFTLSGWFKYDTLPGTNKIGLWGQNDVVEFGFNGGLLSIWTNGGGGTSVAAPEVGQWHHVACVGNGASLKVYLNNTMVAEKVRSTATYGSSSYGFKIGGNGIWSPTGNWFNGYIDGVRVYKRALNASEITGLYNSNE